jgi:hypothetical protein
MRTSARVSLPIALWLTAALLPGSAAVAAPPRSVPSDFNGDGFADLAVGAPREDLPDVGGGEITDAGVVHVIFGSANGLVSNGNQLFRQCIGFCRNNSTRAQPGDQFGHALAPGNFNGDSYSDLAIGIPGDKPGSPGQDEAGAVQVLLGSAGGLTFTGGQYLTQCGTFCGLGGQPEAGDHVGWALAAGDFDADGRADLAIGAPHEDVGTIEDAGLVSVLYGSSGGLITPSPKGTVAAVEVWTQNTSNVNDSSQDDDFFGRALAAGNVGRGAPAELAIGVPGEDLKSHPAVPNEDLESAGAVNVLYGTTTGLSATDDQLWHERIDAPPKAPTIAEDYDLFGWALAIANFGSGPQGDLAVGVVGEDIADADLTGAVDVFYGSDAGLTDAPKQWSEQPRRSGTQFGWSLAAANFGRTPEADLVAGQPRPVLQGSFPGTPIDPGSIAVIYGSATGLTATGRQTWSQDGPVEGEPVNGDLFGVALVAANFGHQAEADVAVGIHRERVSTPSGLVPAGGVNVLYGTSTGLSATNDQLWTQESPGIQDVAEEFDLFGCLANCVPWSLLISI